MEYYNPFSLVGKKILITGASSGIGKGAAIECAKMGATLVLTARNEKRLKETLSELKGEKHEIIVCDLNDRESISNISDSIDYVDGIINNAGYTITKPIQYIENDSFQQIMQVNTIAPILLIKDFLKKKKIKRGASIVFTSSIAGIGRMSVGNTMYGSTKGAISAFIQGAAKELANKGIRVNAVCPAMVESHIMDAGIITKEQVEETTKLYPLGRFGTPEDVARAMIYLLSDASSWVTGINLVVDGGRTLY